MNIAHIVVDRPSPIEGDTLVGSKHNKSKTWESL